VCRADIPPISTPGRHNSVALRLRRRLWAGGLGVACCLATFVIGNQFVPESQAVTRRILGHDFMAFYTAGSFVRQGRYRDLYNLKEVEAFQRQLAQRHQLEIGPSFGPWWNPPFYAWVFAPLAAMPYPQALGLWTAISVLCALASLALLACMLAQRGPPVQASAQEAYEQRLCREDFPAASWKAWALVPLLVVVSDPLVRALSHGQNSCVSLCIFVAGVWAWRKQRGLLAGLILGLLFYKPQLGAIVAAILVLSLGWRALLGLALTGGALAAVTVLTMPGAAQDFVYRLPVNLHFMQIEQPYLWQRHVTLKAFWRLLIQGQAAGPHWLSVRVLSLVGASMLCGLLLVIVVRSRRAAAAKSATALDQVIATATVAMPLMMPFYFDYDLLLLAVPAVLLARNLRTQLHQGGPNMELSPVDRWLLGLWALLFVVMYVNPGLGQYTRVNLGVLLLTAVCLLLMLRRWPSAPVNRLVPDAHIEAPASCAPRS